MEGVTILTVSQSMTWLQFVLAIIGVVFVILGIGIFACAEEKATRIIISAIVFAIGVVSLIVMLRSYETNPYYMYGVAIDESIDVKDLLKEYKISRQDGNIYYIHDLDYKLL